MWAQFLKCSPGPFRLPCADVLSRLAPVDHILLSFSYKSFRCRWTVIVWWDKTNWSSFTFLIWICRAISWGFSGISIFTKYVLVGREACKWRMRKPLSFCSFPTIPNSTLSLSTNSDGGMTNITPCWNIKAHPLRIKKSESKSYPLLSLWDFLKFKSLRSSHFWDI